MPSRWPADADHRRSGFPYGAVAVAIGVIEALVIVVCIAILYVALDSSGGWFTPGTFPARKTLWTSTSTVVLAVIAATFVYDIIYVVKRRRVGLLLIQLVFLAITLGAIIWAHGHIPTPPGLNPDL